MLKKVRRQNWDGNFAYAPPTEEAVINLEEVVSVTVTESRGEGPFVYIRFRDGSHMTCIGVPGDFVAEEKAR